MALAKALQAWSDTKATHLYGTAYVSDYGGALVLPRVILENIVDKVQVRRISSVEDLARETRWRKALAFGEEVLQIIQEHAPIPTLGPAGPSTGDSTGDVLQGCMSHLSKP